MDALKSVNIFSLSTNVWLYIAHTAYKQVKTLSLESLLYQQKMDGDHMKNLSHSLNHDLPPQVMANPALITPLFC